MDRDRGPNPTGLLMQIVLTLMIVVLVLFIPLIIWIWSVVTQPVVAQQPAPTATATITPTPAPAATLVPTPEGWSPDPAVPPVPSPDAARALAGSRIVYESDPANYAYDKVLASRFAHDTGVEVAVTFSSDSTDENYKRYRRLFEDRSSTFDVLLMDVVWTGEFAPHLADLLPALGQEASLHYQGIVDNNVVNGRMIAMPLFGNFGLLYYRDDLLRKYGFGGPPATWDELTSMAQAIQDGERGAGQAAFTGFVFQGQEYEGLTCNALEWIASSGGTIVEDGQVKLNTPQAVDMLRRAQGWVGTISQGVTGFREEDSLNVFRQGNAAFMRNWPYAYAVANQDGSPVKGTFGVAPLPAAPGQAPVGTVGGGQLGVSAYSANREAAIEFVRYMTSPEVQTWRAVHGSFVPTIRTVAEDPQVIGAMPFLKSVAGVARIARPSSAARQQYQEVSSTLYHGISRILRGDDVAQTLGQMDADLRQRLRREP